MRRFIITSSFCLLVALLVPDFVLAQEEETQAPAENSLPLPDVSPEQRAKDEFAVLPTPFEVETAKKQVKDMFKTLLRLWQEERYFEMYQMGYVSSQNTVEEQEFATRMVKLDYLPVFPEDEPTLELKFRYRSLIYVTTRLQFKHKTNNTIKFIKPHQFLLMYENGAWRVDLIQILRSPFYSAFPAEPVQESKS